MSAWIRMSAVMHAANAMGLQYLAVRALGVLAARAAGHLHPARGRRRAGPVGHPTRRSTASAKRSMSSMSL